MHIAVGKLYLLGNDRFHLVEQWQHGCNGTTSLKWWAWCSCWSFAPVKQIKINAMWNLKKKKTLLSVTYGSSTETNMKMNVVIMLLSVTHLAWSSWDWDWCCCTGLRHDRSPQGTLGGWQTRLADITRQRGAQTLTRCLLTDTSKCHKQKRESVKFKEYQLKDPQLFPKRTQQRNEQAVFNSVPWVLWQFKLNKTSSKTKQHTSTPVHDS